MSSDEESINNDKGVSAIDDEQNIEEIEDDIQQPVEYNGNTEEVQRDETAEGDGEGTKDEDKTVVKPKRIVRNPQPKLNEETLKGPKGVAALPSYFERVKFKGKGYEHQDLNAIMKTYEYWCHRLFPKFPFDTCIERLEKLGHKKAVQTHIKRIRFDLLVDEDKPIIDSSDEENNVEGFVDVQNDVINRQFDSLLASSTTEQQGELTEEQLERIKLNKDRAEKLRQERLRKIRDKAEENLEIPSQLPGTSGLESEPTEEQFDSQSDIVSETVQNDISEEHGFDMESNIKGKSIFKGNLVKKKSSKKSNVNSIESDEEEHSTVALQEDYDKLESSYYKDDDKNVEDSLVTKRKNRCNNIIDSDVSDQEMKETVDSSNSSPKDVRLRNISDNDQSDVLCDTTKSVGEVNEGNNAMHLEEELMEVESQTEASNIKSQNLTPTNLENKENFSVDNIIS